MDKPNLIPTDSTAPNRRFSRRSSLLAGLGLLGASTLGLSGCTGRATAPLSTTSADWTAQMSELEKRAGVQLGVCAISQGAPRLEYRSKEAIPMCSTFKVIAVAGLLDKHARDESYWAQKVTVDPVKLVTYSPITSQFAGKEMTISAICDAALRFSDNTAGNLILELLGGPAAVTAFAASKGFSATRLDRTETELNEAVPGDPRDTSTPADLAGLFELFLVGKGLDVIGQTMLRAWMLRNTTSAQRMRTGLPEGAELADKTGSGSYGVVNGVGVVFRHAKPPVSLAVMTRTDQQGSPGKPKLIAQVTQSVLATLG